MKYSQTLMMLPTKLILLEKLYEVATFTFKLSVHSLAGLKHYMHSYINKNSSNLGKSNCESLNLYWFHEKTMNFNLENWIKARHNTVAITKNYTHSHAFLAKISSKQRIY